MYTHSNDIENFTLSETTVFMVEGQGTLIYPKKGQNMKIFQKLKNSALHTTNSYKKLAESYVKKSKKKIICT